MSESDKYKQALEDNFGQNSGANARFGNPNVQKLLQQMDSEREIHTHSWSEGSLASSSSRRSAVDSLVSSSSSGKDRFIPSQQDLIRAVGSSHSKSSSSSSSSSSKSSSSSGKSSSSSSSSSSKSRENQTLTSETKRFVIGLGLLCFIVGAILITFVYSPLNDRGAERVLDGTELAGQNKQATTTVDGAQMNNIVGSDSSSDEPLIVEVDEETAQGLTADKKSLPTTGKVKLDGIKVYVVGAVKNPGIVTLPFDSRVDDAIKAAGGMSDNAEPLSVNLAKRIKDEDKIYVAAKGESDSLSGTGVVEQRADTSGIIAEKAKEASTGSGKVKAKDSGNANSGDSSAAKGDSAPTAEFTVNLNTASEEDLQKIPGVGPSISKSIIDHRNKLPDGKFTNKAQLKDVIGVGDASYSKLEPYVKL